VGPVTSLTQELPRSLLFSRVAKRRGVTAAWLTGRPPQPTMPYIVTPMHTKSWEEKQRKKEFPKEVLKPEGSAHSYEF
jgi:hypothetical protein